MFLSKRKREANRANAQKSTGPLTEIGRERVSRNARKHGLTGAFEVLEGEDQEMFDGLLNRLMEEEKPACLAEIELVKKMAEHTWCSERASRLQEGCFIISRTDEQRRNLEGQAVIDPQLERFTRYQAHHDRAYERASAELLKRRKERLLAERGFVSQQRAEAQEKRRDEKHTWHVERVKTAVAREKVKLEREIIRKEQVKTAAPGQIEPLENPEDAKIAA
ncbi:MAG TPA: hypothetical protein VFA65_01965 [Bryobacteraceae bacterium]|nr:hypothetical protein [Bryobacteraceae bacterium]